MDADLDDILNHKADENEDLYAILGCDELSTKDQIVAEYKSRVLSCHPDKHPGDVDKAKDFERLQSAKDVLCDDEKRENYDKWRRSGMSISYRRWCNMKQSVQTSMHWASPKKEYMLEDSCTEEGHQKQEHVEGSAQDYGSDSNQDTEYSMVWTRDSPTEMLRKFRNYEI